MRSLRLSHQQMQAIVDHCVDSLPYEACGIIAGQGSQAEQIIPVANVAGNPQNHYQLDAGEQIKALKAIEADHLDWIGVFHSHPDGKPIPSQTDIREAVLNTPGLTHLIVGMKNNQIRMQAWRIHDTRVDDVELLIGQQQSAAMPGISRLEVWAVVIAVLIGITILLAVSFILLPPAPPLPTPQ